MDEKNKQAPTLDDILNQLTKSPIIQGPGQNMERPISKPLSLPSTQAPTSAQPSLSSNIRLPSLGGESKVPVPGTSPSSSIPEQPSGISLSIRTMSQDIDRIRMGQRPIPIELKKVIQPALQQKPLVAPQPEETAQEVPQRVVTVPPSIRPTLPPRPTTPIRPPVPVPPSQRQGFTFVPQPQEKTPKEYMQEHYHREEIVGKTDDMLPEYPGAPVPKKMVAPKKENLEYGLIARIIGSGMTTGIIATVIIAVAMYFVLTLFVFNGEELVPSASPTPSPQITQTPIVNELEAIFWNVSTVNFNVPSNQVEAVASLHSFIKETEITPREFKRIKFILPDNQSTNVTLTDILDRLSVRYPASLRDAIRESNMIFMYGQAEVLGNPESLPDPGLAGKKVVFVVEVDDALMVTAMLQGWEPTMAEDLKNIFNIDSSRAATRDFNSNQYRGVPIRYKNFPLPDRSIDYAIINSLSGKKYLLITNSRESMYSPIEKISGL